MSGPVHWLLRLALMRAHESRQEWVTLDLRGGVLIQGGRVMVASREGCTLTLQGRVVSSREGTTRAIVKCTQLAEYLRQVGEL